MKKWISLPRREGVASRQAHCDLPTGTYEREFGKEGFFGPATQFYHRHPPTGWSAWQGGLRPRAFDLTKLNHVAASPWDAGQILYNGAVKLRSSIVLTGRVSAASWNPMGKISNAPGRRTPSQAGSLRFAS